MTDTEFDVLDELYFVQSFAALQQVLVMPEFELKDVLQGLMKKGWIKCFKSAAEELPAEEVYFENEFKNYYYLATKAGLLAHNSR
jgi:hypothetical protein